MALSALRGRTAIRQDDAREQVKVVRARGVRHVEGAARDGPGRGVQQARRVPRLEHVPVRLQVTTQASGVWIA